jgi:hypothetical protein
MAAANQPNAPMITMPHLWGGAHLFDPTSRRYISASPCAVDGDVLLFVSDNGGKNVAVSMNPNDALALAAALQSAAVSANSQPIASKKEAA